MLIRIILLRIIISSLFFSSFFSACRTKDDYSNSPLSNFKDNRFVFPEGDLNSFFVVPLEFTLESAISGIREILFDDGHIFIMDQKGEDRRADLEIKVFDMKGNFLSKVSSSGRGPGEYFPDGIRTFDLDRKRKEIIIFDARQKKMMRYSYDGRFLRENSFSDYRGLEFAYLGSDEYVFRLVTGMHEVVVTDSVGRIISTHNHREEKSDDLFLAPASPFFAKTSNGSVFYIPMWDDKIYTITTNGLDVVKDYGLKDKMVSEEKDLAVFNEEMAWRTGGPVSQLEKYSFFQNLVLTTDSLYYVECGFFRHISMSVYTGSKIPLWISGYINKGVRSYGDYLHYYEPVDGVREKRSHVIESITDRLVVDWYPQSSYKDFFVLETSYDVIKRHFPFMMDQINNSPEGLMENPYLLFYKISFKDQRTENPL